MSPATEKLLLNEAWRNERVINLFRAGVWTVICGAILVSQGGMDFLFSAVIAAGFVYGLSCAVLSATWLRRRYHPAVPYVMTTLDIAVLTGLALTTQLVLLATSSPLADWQLYTTSTSYMLLVAVNTLRFSWRAALYSMVVAAAGYIGVLVLWQMRQTGAIVVNVIHIVAVGVILAYGAFKMRLVVQRVKERDALTRFLPAPLVEQVSRDPGSLVLGGEKQDATVLFTDIRGFTTMAETMDPGEVVQLLNEYFEQMVDEIFSHQGVLDKFIGDGICAVFARPLEPQEAARRAVRCAQGMLERLETINQRRAARGQPLLRIGIGVHSGTVVAGNIGSTVRMEYTHIGDTVNTASRIESLTKELRVPALISHTTVERAGDADLPLEPVGEHTLRGRPHPVVLYKLAGPSADAACAPEARAAGA